jgi:hypothetical protein
MVQSFENENLISENTCEVFMNDGMGKKKCIEPQSSN